MVRRLDANDNDVSYYYKMKNFYDKFDVWTIFMRMTIEIPISFTGK